MYILYEYAVKAVEKLSSIPQEERKKHPLTKHNTNHLQISLNGMIQNRNCADNGFNETTT